MESYQVMVVINGIMLVLTGGMLAAIWSSMQKDKSNTREDFKEIWKTIHNQNQSIQQTLKLAELNQQAIKTNQREMIDIQHDIKEQNIRVNKFWETYNLEESKRK
jgi:hypothetical protein